MKLDTQEKCRHMLMTTVELTLRHTKMIRETFLMFLKAI